MESKELREKLKYTYIDYGMALVVSGHQLTPFLDDALRIIEAWHTTQTTKLQAEARIDELKNIQLEYGHYVAQTFVSGRPMSIEKRIAELEREHKIGEGNDL